MEAHAFLNWHVGGYHIDLGDTLHYVREERNFTAKFTHEWHAYRNKPGEPARYLQGSFIKLVGLQERSVDDMLSAQLSLLQTFPEDNWAISFRRSTLGVYTAESSIIRGDSKITIAKNHFSNFGAAHANYAALVGSPSGKLAIRKEIERQNR